MPRTLAMSSLLLACLSARAADPPPVPTAMVTAFTLRPAAEPVPALKYKLLPDLREQTPGNAAQLYYRAFSPEWQAHRRQKDIETKLERWGKLPLKDLPRDEMRWLTASPMLKEIDRAARRSYCDWELTARVRESGIGLLLPDIQGFREAAWLLDLRARLQIAEGNFADAIATLETGLALGRHISEGPTLIQSLVGNAIATVMLARLDELIQQPGAPNLYWALTDLPAPFIDLRTPLQGERLFIDQMMPGLRDRLRDPKLPPLTPADLRKFQLNVQGLAAGEGRDLFTSAVGGILVAAARYPDARRQLIALGRTAEQVEAMPATQVVMMAELHVYDRYFDDISKWQGLPYWKARPGLERVNRQLLEERRRGGGQGSLALLLLPAIDKVVFSRVRLDRRIASLRVVEALRLHAAAHKGTLPATLADLTDVPLPVDPVTGKPFAYTLDGNKAVLSGPPPAGEAPHPGNNFRYELTLAPEKK